MLQAKVLGFATAAVCKIFESALATHFKLLLGLCVLCGTEVFKINCSTAKSREEMLFVPWQTIF